MSNVITQRFIKCHNALKANGQIRSSRQFAMTLDYLPQSLSEILNHRRDVTIDLLRKIVEKYKVNPVYILSGDGPMFMTEEGNTEFRTLTIVTTVDDSEKILHVPAPAQAAYAAELNDPSFIQELPAYNLPDYKYMVGTHRSFDVSGDNMEPTLFEGDKVICSFVEPTYWETALKDSYVYVAVTKADLLVGRLENQLKHNRYIKISSDNTYYEPHLIRQSEIRELWYVRAKISPFLPAPGSIKNQLQQEVNELKKLVNQQNHLIEQMGRSVQELLNGLKGNK